MAVKTLQTLLRHAHQQFIVIVRIVSVSAKVRVDAFNSGLIITTKINPIIIGWHRQSLAKTSGIA
jgi:hypothetical protein